MKQLWLSLISEAIQFLHSRKPLCVVPLSLCWLQTIMSLPNCHQCAGQARPPLAFVQRIPDRLLGCFKLYRQRSRLKQTCPANQEFRFSARCCGSQAIQTCHSFHANTGVGNVVRRRPWSSCWSVLVGLVIAEKNIYNTCIVTPSLESHSITGMSRGAYSVHPRSKC